MLCLILNLTLHMHSHKISNVFLEKLKKSKSNMYLTCLCLIIKLYKADIFIKGNNILRQLIVLEYNEFY